MEEGRTNEKRGTILDSAERLFAARGPAATIDEIAREAGVAKGTVYLYFPSKEELYLSLVEDRIDSYLVQSRQALLEAGPAEEVLRLLVHMRMQFVSEHLGLLNTLFQSCVPGTAHIHERIFRAKRTAQRVFAEAIERSLPRLSVDTEHFLIMVSGMADHLVMHQVYLHGTFDPEATAETVLQLALPSLKAVVAEEIGEHEQSLAGTDAPGP